MPPVQRHQLQRQNGVEEQRLGTAAPSGVEASDVLPPVPVPQVLGIRPATPAPIHPPPAPALAHSDPLMPPANIIDLLPPSSTELINPIPQYHTATATTTTQQFSPIPSTSTSVHGIPPLPPFPTLRPDLAALMQSDGEMGVVQTGSSRGVKRGLEDPPPPPTGKQSKKSR